MLLKRIRPTHRLAIKIVPCALFLAALGCPKAVHVPAPGQDHPPSLTIGYSDTTVHDFLSVSNGGPVKLPLDRLYHHFLLTASAQNDGELRRLRSQSITPIEQFPRAILLM